MGSQCRGRVVRRVYFAVVQIQYVAYVKTRRSRLTARHFDTVQKSEKCEHHKTDALNLRNFR